MDQRNPKKYLKIFIFSFLLLGFGLAAAAIYLVDSMNTAAAGRHDLASSWGLPVSLGDIGLVSENSSATPTPFQPLPPTAFATIEMLVPTEIAQIMPTELPPTSTPYLYELIDTTTPEPTQPFQNIDPALEGTITIEPLTSTLTISTTSTVPTPEALLTAAPELEKLPRQINILLLGADRRPYEAGFRTDTIILVTVNTELGRVNITSFPRDLWLTLPGWGMSRINTAWTYGGWNMLHETFKHNFGIDVNYHMLVDFSSFKQFIDDMGGLEVNVHEPVSDYRRGYWVTIKKGPQHMDADTVLWYVRTRKTTNDIARNRRQQEVIEALLEKFVSIDGIRRAPEIFDLYDHSVKTDLKMIDVLRWLPFMAKVIENSRNPILLHHLQAGV